MVTGIFEPHADPFKRAHKTQLFDNSFGQFLVVLHQVFRLSEENIFGPKHKFYRLAFFELYSSSISRVISLDSNLPLRMLPSRMFAAPRKVATCSVLGLL